MLGDYFLYSHGLSDLENVDVAKRNSTLSTVGALCSAHKKKRENVLR